MIPASLPNTMTAIEIAAPGGPEQLRPTTRPLPVPGPGEVLIEVAAAGVNRPDVVQRLGHYAPPPGASDLPGLEVAGRVVALGADVSGLALGESVCALLTGGGYAEYCTAPAVQCLPVPAALSLAEAAAVPETFFTVWHNVFERGALQPGESLLVHGGSSGIGQGIDLTTFKPIRSTGGWAEFWYDFTPCFHTHFGYSVDDPDDRDLSTVGERRYNQV